MEEVFFLDEVTPITTYYEECEMLAEIFHYLFMYVYWEQAAQTEVYSKFYLN